MYFINVASRRVYIYKILAQVFKIQMSSAVVFIKKRLNVEIEEVVILKIMILKK